MTAIVRPWLAAAALFALMFAAAGPAAAQGARAARASAATGEVRIYILLAVTDQHARALAARRKGRGS